MGWSAPPLGSNSKVQGSSFTAAGSVDARFFGALVELLVNPWQPAVSAGRHGCDLCRFSGGPGSPTFAGRTVQLGVNNLFVPDADAQYVAPSPIAHAIDAHGSVPPLAFQEAVVRCPPMRSMEYLRAIEGHAGTALR